MIKTTDNETGKFLDAKWRNLNIVQFIYIIEKYMSIYDFKVKDGKGQEFSMSQFEGDVLLIVNTATKCGFTPQHKGLQELYDKYREQGFEVLDFPCNQFGHQAPGTDDEIHEFCTAKYNTTFDQMAKVEVNGDKAEPVFAYLKEEISEDPEPKGMKNKLAMKTIAKLPGAGKEKGFIKWNFTKFLVSREGCVVNRYAPITKPEKIEQDIFKLL